MEIFKSDDGVPDQETRNVRCRVTLNWGHPHFVGSKKHWSPGIDVAVQSVERSESGGGLVLGSLTPNGVCPDCGFHSRRRHGWRRRRLQDYPAHGNEVTVDLAICRWRCQAPACPRRTFSDQIASIVRPFACRTSRVGEIVSHLRHATGGRPHTLRVHLQDLDIRAGQIHPQSDPPDAGTEHIAGQSKDPTYNSPDRLCVQSLNWRRCLAAQAVRGFNNELIQVIIGTQAFVASTLAKTKSRAPDEGGCCFSQRAMSVRAAWFISGGAKCVRSPRWPKKHAGRPTGT
ncbi:zinc-finger of transposase IS204/IS1001/IS1096/IS1165 [Paracoccus homiensis]|uniref:Zinc-finger of transposase IS204/IS1001/IS1096/IS1165 n=1 Tax=Paracoccus homiensis TaxID=364199 RepID=A0A1I0JER1_9RHOB|nr:zinc-finger of transposase IS204/IS1001/IS1096/IS1165 [Paracoccus homiensis]